MATLLSYSISPDRAFVSLQTTFTLTVTNPLGADPVTLTGGRRGDQITVTFPCPPAQSGADALVDSIDFTAQSGSPQFTAGQSTSQDSTFVIAPVGTQVLQPGSSFQVVFSPVTVNGTTGSPRLTVTEYFAAGQNATQLTVTKEPQQLAIIAWASPYVVGLGQPATLYWQSFAGTSVTVYGFSGGTGSKTFPVQGEPPYPGNDAVTVPADQAQWTFTLQVNTNSGEHAKDEVTLTQHAPLIQSMTPAQPAVAVAPAESVPLSWATLYAARCTLQSDGGSARKVPANPLNPMIVVPGKDAVQSAPTRQQIPASITYTLTAQGFGKPAAVSRRFDIGPAALLYFKYAQCDAGGRLSGLSYQVDPPDWPCQLMPVGDGGVLTVYQPGGGSIVAYLGGGDTRHPQVQYFSATSGSGGVVLNWVTANVTTLRLDPPGTDIAAGDIAKGSLTVQPSGPTSYVLTATAASGERITSTLAVHP